MINGYSAETGASWYLPVMDLGSGAVSKVEALYYTNVTFVAYE